MDRTDRLAVMLLYSHNISEPNYGPCLKCALGYYVQNLMPSTPTDLFLFVKPEYSQQIAQISWVTKTPNLYIMHLDDSDESSWKIPEWVRPLKVDNTNVGFNHVWSAGFSNEYRLMGHWRLGFSFPFAKELGYKYMLQVSGVNSSITELMCFHH